MAASSAGACEGPLAQACSVFTSSQGLLFDRMNTTAPPGSTFAAAHMYGDPRAHWNSLTVSPFGRDAWMDSCVHSPSVDAASGDAVVELGLALMVATAVGAEVPSAEGVAEQPYKNADTAIEEATASAIAVRRITELPPELGCLLKVLYAPM